MDTKQAEIASVLLAKLAGSQSELPTLPDIAIRLKSLLDDPDFSAESVIRLLASDPVISMHVMRAANSAALSAGHPVYNLHDAVARLGYRMLHSMVVNITLNRLFRAKNPLIDRKLKELWEHSREVAASSYVLARSQAHLRPELAMLAGLVHDIGALPLYLCADQHFPQITPDALEDLINEHAASMTPDLLRNWNFPEELIEIVAGHATRQNSACADCADYVDVLTVANLQSLAPKAPVPWRNMLAAERLGYYVADCRDFLKNHSEMLTAVKNMLRINASQPA